MWSLWYRPSLGMRFAVLETLWLDDNKLTDQTTFSTLAGLRRSVVCICELLFFAHTYSHARAHIPTHTRLKYVNLDNNELYSVPQLRLIGNSRLRSTNERGSSSHTRTSATPRPGQRSTESRGQGSSGGKDVKSFEETFDCERGNERATDSATTRTVTLVSEGGSGCEGEKSASGDGDRCAGGGNGDSGECEGRETGGPTETPVSVTGLPPSMAPFPQLHTLSLANNLVSRSLSPYTHTCTLDSEFCYCSVLPNFSAVLFVRGTAGMWFVASSERVNNSWQPTRQHVQG